MQPHQPVRIVFLLQAAAAAQNVVIDMVFIRLLVSCKLPEYAGSAAIRVRFAREYFIPIQAGSCLRILCS